MYYFLVILYIHLIEFKDKYVVLIYFCRDCWEISDLSQYFINRIEHSRQGYSLTHCKPK